MSETTGFRRHGFAFGFSVLLRDEIASCEAELADLRAKCEAGGDGAT